MIIVVEGPDNAGKSTMAQTMAKMLKAIYIKTENVPPHELYLKQYNAVLKMAEDYGNGIVVSDRHVAISDPIYGPIIRGWTKVDKFQALHAVHDIIDVLVYCRPSDEAMLKSMNDREQMDGVAKHARPLIAAYDAFFAEREKQGKVYRYDWTKDSLYALIQEVKRHA